MRAVQSRARAAANPLKQVAARHEEGASRCGRGGYQKITGLGFSSIWGVGFRGLGG